MSEQKYDSELTTLFADAVGLHRAATGQSDYETIWPTIKQIAAHKDGRQLAMSPMGSSTRPKGVGSIIRVHPTKNAGWARRLEYQ